MQVSGNFPKALAKKAKKYCEEHNCSNYRLVNDSVKFFLEMKDKDVKSELGKNGDSTKSAEQSANGQSRQVSGEANSWLW